VKNRWDLHKDSLCLVARCSRDSGINDAVLLVPECIPTPYKKPDAWLAFSGWIRGISGDKSNKGDDAAVYLEVTDNHIISRIGKISSGEPTRKKRKR
jgi:hypothetical protein